MKLSRKDLSFVFQGKWEERLPLGMTLEEVFETDIEIDYAKEGHLLTASAQIEFSRRIDNLLKLDLDS